MYLPVGIIAAVFLLPALLLVCVEKRRKKDATPLVGASMANRKAASAKGFKVDPLLQPEWQKNMAIIKQKQGGMAVSLKQFADGDGDSKPGAAAHMAAREQALEMVMRAPSATPDPHALPAYLTKQLGPRVPRRNSLANAWSNNENESNHMNVSVPTKSHTVTGAMVPEDVDSDVDGGGGGKAGADGAATAAATTAAAAPKPAKVRFERWSQQSSLQRPEPAAAQLPAPPALESSSRSVVRDTSIMVRTAGLGDDDDDDDNRPSRSSAPTAAVAAAALAASASCSGANTPTSVSSRRLYHQQSQQQYLQQQRSPHPQERSSRNASGSASWAAAAALSSPQPPPASNAVAPAPSGPGTPTAVASPSQIALNSSRRLHQHTFGDSGRGSSPATPGSAAGAGFSRHGSRDALVDAPGGSGGTGLGSVGSAPLTEEVTPLGSEGGASGGSAGPGSGGRGPAALRTAANMRGPSRLGTTASSPLQPTLAAGAAVQWPSLAIDEAAGEGVAASGVGRAVVTSPGEVVHDSDLLPGAPALASPSPAAATLQSPGYKQGSISGQHHQATAAAMLHSTLMTPSLRTALGSAAPPPLGKAPDTGPASAPVRATAGTSSHPSAFSPVARGAGTVAATGAAATITGASPSDAAAATGRAADGPQARRASMLSIESDFNELKEQFSNQSRWLLEQLAGGAEPAPPTSGPRPPRGMPPLPELGGVDDDDAMPLPTAAPPPRTMPRRAVTLTSATTPVAAAAMAGGLRLGAVGTDAAGTGTGSQGGMKGGISASGGLESGPAGAGGGGLAAAAAAGKALRRQTSDAPAKSLYHGAYDQLQAMWMEHKQSQHQSAQPPSLQSAPSPPRSYRTSEPNEPVSYRMLKQAASSGVSSYQRLQPQPPAQPQHQAGGPPPVPRPVQLSWSASGEVAPRISPSGGDDGGGGGGGPSPGSFMGAGQARRSPGGAAGVAGPAAVSPSRAGGAPQRVSPGGTGLPPRPVVM